MVSCKFTVEDHQHGPDGYEGLTEDDLRLIKHFRTVLGERNLELLQHHERSAELRAIFYSLGSQLPGNVEGWLEKYAKYEWDVIQGDGFLLILRAGVWNFSDYTVVSRSYCFGFHSHFHSHLVQST